MNVFMPPRRNRGESNNDYHARYIEQYQVWRKRRDRLDQIRFAVLAVAQIALSAYAVFMLYTNRIP